MEEQKNPTKGVFIGGCAVGLIIGIVLCGCGIGIVAFWVPVGLPRNVVHHNMFFDQSFTSTTEVLGQYELADADAVKEFNTRVKAWFAERGFEEQDMPLRSIERMTTRGTSWSKGNWDMPGELLLLKFDDQNSIYILVPDCYHREAHNQMIGCRSDFGTSFDRLQEYSIRLDKLKDDFERAFPSGDYMEGLPNDMP